MLIKDCIILAILVVLGPREVEIRKVPTGIIDQKKAVKYEILQITNLLMLLVTFLINFVMGFILFQRSLHCSCKE